MINTRTFLLAGAIFALVSGVVSAQDDPHPGWDELSGKVIPQLLAANADSSAMAKRIRKAGCRIDIRVTSSSFLNPIGGTLQYRWEDRNNDRKISRDELKITVSKSGEFRQRALLQSFATQLTEESLLTTSRLLKQFQIKTEKKNGGYRMVLTSNNFTTVQRFGYSKLILSLSADFRVTEIRAENGAGQEFHAKLQHQKIQGRWYTVGFRRTTTFSTGGSIVETRKSTIKIVKGVPVLAKIVESMESFTSMGTVRLNKEWTFRGWTVDLRPQGENNQG